MSCVGVSQFVHRWSHKIRLFEIIYCKRLLKCVTSSSSAKDVAACAAAVIFVDHGGLLLKISINI